MSRIGNKVIVVLEGVEIQVQPAQLLVKGPKGEVVVPYESEYVSFKQDGAEVTVSRANETKDARSRHGLYRTLLSNAIEGVKNGYEKKLQIIGVGYRAAMKGTDLEMQLGYSHPILFKAPSDVTVEIDKEDQNIVIVSGIDKQKVGQSAAKIREYRKPEPYKGKGIRYVGEYVRRKAGKSAAK